MTVHISRTPYVISVSDFYDEIKPVAYYDKFISYIRYWESDEFEIFRVPTRYTS